jgi:hypothetical protein
MEQDEKQYYINKGGERNKERDDAVAIIFAFYFEINYRNK